MEDRIYIAIFPNYWGRGTSIETAKAEARKQGARGRDYIVYLLPEGTTSVAVDFMGRVQWSGSNGDAEVVKRSGKAKEAA